MSPLKVGSRCLTTVGYKQVLGHIKSIDKSGPSYVYCVKLDNPVITYVENESEVLTTEIFITSKNLIVLPSGLRVA